MALNYIHNLVDQNGKNDSTRQKTSAWVGRIIRQDEKGGRRQSEFAVPGLSEKIRSDTDKYRKDGVDVFQGGGNIFFASDKTGEPIVLQSRPLAQRVVRLRFI